MSKWRLPAALALLALTLSCRQVRPAVVSVLAWPGVDFPGTLDLVSPVMDMAARAAAAASREAIEAR